MPPSAPKPQRKCSRQHGPGSFFLFVLLPILLQQSSFAHEACHLQSGTNFPLVATHPKPAGRLQTDWPATNNSPELHRAVGHSSYGKAQAMLTSSSAFAPAALKQDIRNSSRHAQVSITKPWPKFRRLLMGISQRPAMPAHAKVTEAAPAGRQLEHKQSQAALQSSTGTALTAGPHRSLKDVTAQSDFGSKTLPSAALQQYIFVMKVRELAHSNRPHHPWGHTVPCQIKSTAGPLRPPLIN